MCNINVEYIGTMCSIVGNVTSKYEKEINGKRNALQIMKQYVKDMCMEFKRLPSRRRSPIVNRLQGSRRGGRVGRGRRNRGGRGRGAYNDDVGNTKEEKDVKKSV